MSSSGHGSGRGASVRWIMTISILCAAPHAAHCQPVSQDHKQKRQQTGAVLQDPTNLASAVRLGARWGVVTSVKRSRDHNRAVSGALNSFHLFGRAVDIARRPDISHADIENGYKKAGFQLVESLDEGDHSHFAFGTGGSSAKSGLRQRSEFVSPASKSAKDCGSDRDSSALTGRRRPDKGCLTTEDWDPAAAKALAGANKPQSFPAIESSRADRLPEAGRRAEPSRP